MINVPTEKKIDCCPHCESTRRASLCVGYWGDTEHDFTAEYRKYGEEYHTLVDLVACLDCGTVYVPQVYLTKIKEGF